jgi:hypothetical protein
MVVNFVDCADVGMVEGGRGLRFTLEAGQSLRVFSNIIREELQGIN